MYQFNYWARDKTSVTTDCTHQLSVNMLQQQLRILFNVQRRLCTGEFYAIRTPHNEICLEFLKWLSNIECIYQACITLWYGCRCYAIYNSRSKQRQHIRWFYVISIPGCCKFHANGQIEPSKDYTTWWGKTGGRQRSRDVWTIAGMGSEVSVSQCDLKVTMMTSSNGNILCVTGPFWGESTGHRHEDSPHKGQWRGALMFSLICAWKNGWANNRGVGIWDAIPLIMTSL